MGWAVLLSGEHPTLPAAELESLLAVHAPGSTLRREGLLARVEGPDPEGVAHALRRMVLAHGWGHCWGTFLDTPAGLAQAEALVQARCDGAGSLAVASQRRGAVDPRRCLEAERRLGAAAKRAGHAIDLERPRRTLFAWLLDGRLVVGGLGGGSLRSAHEGRASDRRAHFSPIALHPRRAASLLHLARVPPGGRVLDPFCGTGTFVLEAAIEGHDAWGADLDPWMVQGTLTTLADAGPEPLAGTVFQADIADLPRLVEGVQGIVTDLPYGRASTGHDRELADLYERALAVFAQLLPPGGRAVVGHAQPELLAGAAAHGLEAVESHAERAHRSLTRHFTVLRRGWSCRSESVKPGRARPGQAIHGGLGEDLSPAPEEKEAL